MENLSPKIKTALGVTCALGYAFSFQLADMFYKYTYNHSKVQAFEALLLRYITSFVIIASHMLADRKSPLESKSNTLYMVLASVFKLAGSLFFHYSLAYIDMGTSAVILAAMPPVSMVLAWLLLKEKTKLSENLLGALSYVGVLLVVWTRLEAPKSDPYSYAIGIALCFLAVVCLSLYSVTLRKISGKSDLRKSLFHINLVGVVILCLAQLVLRTDFVLTKAPVKFSWFLLIGGVVFFLALLMEIVSLKCLNVGVIMIIRNTEFIWAYLYDIIFDGVYPTFVIILGILLIVLSASLIAINLMKDIQYVEGFKFVLSKIFGNKQKE